MPQLETRPATGLRRVAPALGLFALAPFIGEFLLGNLTVSEWGIGVLLMPLYGGGALLIRETARRTGRGWPTILLLAAAYALIEEGPVDQLLWNDSYAGHDLLHGDSYLPAIGMSVELTLTILALHTIWSICVPIAIIEALVPDRRTEPWLRTPGLAATAIVYLAGVNLVFWGTLADEHFLATPTQFASLGLVIAALIAAAFRIGRNPRPPLPGRAPDPRTVGLIALAGTSAYWAPAVLVTADWYEWVGVVVWCAVAVCGGLLIARWSRQAGWDARHVFALAAGATLTYAWTAFPSAPESGGSATADLIGNTVFALIAILILLAAGRAVSRPNALESSDRCADLWKRAREPHDLTAIVGGDVVAFETELLEDSERRRIPGAHGRPEPLPPGKGRGLDDCGRRLGGVAVAVHAFEELVGDLGLVERGPADGQPAVPDEVALLPAADRQQGDPRLGGGGESARDDAASLLHRRRPPAAFGVEVAECFGIPFDPGLHGQPGGRQVE